jgi:hypothetical protein
MEKSKGNLKKIILISIFFLIFSAVSVSLQGCKTLNEKNTVDLMSKGDLKWKKDDVKDMSKWELNQFTNSSLKKFLEESIVSEEFEREFWLPMMTKLVQAKGNGKIQKLWIPLPHLEKAVNYYNGTSAYDNQEPTVFVYYWQLYNDPSKRKNLYGYSNKEEKEKRKYLRKYLPALFERHKHGDFKKFDKMYRLVNRHDSMLVKELFATNPYE